MTPSARLSAAIEIFADIEIRRRPAAEALKDWGLAHRFAGSGDRAAIASLVHDGLRRKASAAWLMGEGTPRAVLLGALALARGYDEARIAALCSGERHAPAPLSEAERAALRAGSQGGAPPWVRGDYPQWLDPALAASFGAERVNEMMALAKRAPVDLRVNTLKTDRAMAEAELAHFGAAPTPYAPTGLRVLVGEDARQPALQAEPAFQKGWFEVQDEGSQLAALLAAPAPGSQVVDLCAGAGGKTLALAALLDNRGQIFAADSETRRLAPIFERLARAGARNVQVRAPRGRGHDPLADLAGKADLTLVDAPCTGTGTWRRNPDAKWRVRPGSLATRIAEQAAVLDRAAGLTRPGGRIAYVTCSLLPAENDDAVAPFLARAPDFTLIPPAQAAADAGLPALADCLSPAGLGLQLTPLRMGTDGFYIALLRRAA